MNRFVPKIEWAIPITAKPNTTTAPVVKESRTTAEPLPPETLLADIPVIGPLGAKPLQNAGYTTVGELDELLNGAANPAQTLTKLKGIGITRAETILAALSPAETSPEPVEQAPAPAETLESVPIGPLKELFGALDVATSVSKGQLELSENYPRLVETAGRAYLVARWGGVSTTAHRLTLLRRDVRFHKVPPLGNSDCGMVECREDN